ncbi:ubinuclein-2-like [Daucus carota subsp. sativus]|uniref:ubinuclein-2-like n=1 Tax=Daucus carota subsp. sativus TaxID=79200 RepID=UPI0030836654
MDSAGITNNDSVSAGGVNQRERFSVELTPGHTNIVSLKKLRREAGEVVSDDSLEEENEAVSLNTSNIGKNQHSESSNLKDPVQLENKSKDKGKKISSSAILKFHDDKSTQHERSMSKQVEQRLERTTSEHLTEAPKSGDDGLDRSILQLENLVKLSKAPLTHVQGPDAIEKQLSPELKQNLAEVARSTQLIEGEISEELINRLMGILGNYIKRKTLKKILKEMILEDVYARKTKCSDFKQTKKDLVEMIRHQAPSSNVKEFSTSEHSTGTYGMGHQLEDKLFDVYDTFCQGSYKDMAPSLIRKLYVELAELWPKDTMDPNQIREAIWRARGRRMAVGHRFKLELSPMTPAAKKT